jgi:hypothetical protein
MSLPDITALARRLLHRTLVNSAMPSDSNLAEHLSREPRWPALIAVLAITALYWSLPERLTPGPSWSFPIAVAVLLIPTVAFHVSGRATLNSAFGIALLSLITIAIAWSLGALIAALLDKREAPGDLLRSAVALWCSNVLVFASWYWRLDAGGPHKRDLRPSHTEGAFLFPQMMLHRRSKLAPSDWKPGFVDYLFLAFNTSTAFSPTDVPALSRWAKVLMMVQSCISLGTVAILAARAINIL